MSGTSLWWRRREGDWVWLSLMLGIASKVGVDGGEMGSDVLV